MSKSLVMIGGGILALAVLAGAAVLAIEQAKRAAVADERRERMADAIDLIRTTDKALGVKRKASDADLCRALGGEPGECQ